ncbi:MULTISPECIES: YoaK family protein [unclassified Moraxella]|uniref:YoaK family protein n=1 Tax=unclassified Moraxella TaxID=2685852 RepID=UPI003AF8A2B8
MIERLPRWILYGGCILAFNAGCINSTALVGFTHLSASHVTGNVTLFASAFAEGDFEKMAMVCIVLLSFLFGATISGFVVGSTALQAGRRYGVALLIEACLLTVSLVLFSFHSFWGQVFSAMACGLQNSMVATYSGAVIRTTHLTGLTSDMGSAIGNMLAGRQINKKMFVFQSMIWYSFCGGGVVGAFGYLTIHYLTLILPIVIVLSLAFLYHFKLRLVVD